MNGESGIILKSVMESDICINVTTMKENFRIMWLIKDPQTFPKDFLKSIFLVKNRVNLSEIFSFKDFSLWEHLFLINSTFNHSIF